MNEVDFQRLRINQIADVRLSVDSERHSRAELIRVSPVVDPNFGKMKATFRMLGNDPALMPGQLVELFLVLETHENVLLVSKRALVYESGIPVVFVAQDSFAFRRTVKLGLQTGDIAELRSGLTEGERLIVDGQTTLQDSSKIKIVTPLQ